MATVTSVLAALAAAAMFGASSVLQQSEARQESGPILRLGLLLQLARRPRWLAAIGLAALSYGMLGLALAFGPLLLVQPLAATDLVFALPLLARRDRRRAGATEWTGAAMVTVGVALFLVLSLPKEGHATPSAATWAPVLAAVVVVAVATTALALRSGPRARTALLAAGGAVVFALVDALTKSFVVELRAHGVAALARWEPYVLMTAGITSLLLAQSAFRSGPLLVSLPIIDALEPTGAVLIGATVFGEHIASSPPLLAGQLFAGVVAVAGIVVLDRSPLIGPRRPGDAVPP